MRYAWMAAAAVGVLAVGCAGPAKSGGPAAAPWHGTKPVVAFTNPEALEPGAGMALRAVPAAPSPYATKPVVAFMNPNVGPAVAHALPTRACGACGETLGGTKPVVAFTAPPKGCRTEGARMACAEAPEPCPQCVAAK